MEALKHYAIAAMVLAVVGCTSQSAVLTNDAGQTFQCSNQGWGWIGAPVAMANQSSCIKKAQAAGYKESGSIGNLAPKPNQAATKIDMAFPAGWEAKPVSDAQHLQGITIAANNPTADLWVLVGTTTLAGITDRDIYALSRRAAQESRLKDAIHSEISATSINGLPAKRFEVSGISPDGARDTFLYTAIFGQSEVVVVNAWTTAPNFDQQKGALEGLAERVSGVH